MNLYRYRIALRGAWRTQWQADTLTGRLCGLAGQVWGARRFRAELLDFLAEGMPPFVASDAFPGDLLPVPILLRLRDWGETERKAVKRARWLAPPDFERARRGEPIAADALLRDDAIVSRDRLQNTISRQSGTTGENSLFSEREMFLCRKGELARTDGVDCRDAGFLSLYVRIEAGFEERFGELLDTLGLEGFGADASAGYGAFCVAGEREPLPEWDALPGADGVITLSTFQPAPGDPTEGYWEAFVKYGKLGPEFGLENVFKRPLPVLRPGACFRGGTETGFLGRSVPASEFLEAETARLLAARDVFPIHPAYGLTLPLKWVAGDKEK